MLFGFIACFMQRKGENSRAGKNNFVAMNSVERRRLSACPKYPLLGMESPVFHDYFDIKKRDMKILLSILIFISVGITSQAQPLKSFKDDASGAYGFKDLSGKVILKPQFNEVTVFFEGMIGVHTGGTPGAYGIEGGSWGFVDSTGKLAIKPTYEQIHFFKDGFCAVKLNGKFGFINKTGKMVIAATYDEVHNFEEGMAMVNLDKKCGYIDKSGKIIIPLKYTFADDFSEGMAAVSLEGRVEGSGNNFTIYASFGYIDKKDKLIIPYQFAEAYKFEHGGAWVTRNGREYVIDRTGKEIVR
jgi:hypothetical protein